MSSAKAYDLIVNGIGKAFESAEAAIQASYDGEVTDEFIKPAVIVRDGKPVGNLEEGDAVNLERALRVGDRLGGHFVQGHVDATADLVALEPEGDDHRLEIALPDSLAPLVAFKGSICVDGISLTVAEVKEQSFVCWITPHTFTATHLHRLQAGNHRVNLEADMLVRHLHRMLELQKEAGE